MSIQAVVEYSNKGFLVYAHDYPGAFSRSSDRSGAINKLPADVSAYCRWIDTPSPVDSTITIIQEAYTDIAIEDADSEVIFDSEKLPLSYEEYCAYKALILKSTRDVLLIFDSIPDINKTNLPPRKTFYGEVPRTAKEMVFHINTVTEYYMAQVGVSIKNAPDMLRNREQAFALLEAVPNYLTKNADTGSFGEVWSLRKVLRRFIWHDRIHAKALYRMANSIWKNTIINPFYFT